MQRRMVLGLAAVAVMGLLGCNDSRSELARMQAELKKTRAEFETLKAQRANTYLDELERLEALRAKGVLTEEEFAAKKAATLQGNSKPPGASPTVQELAKQFRDLQGLYNAGAITSADREQKKRQLIAGPLAPIGPGDLKSDLELVQTLYNESTINNAERDALKKRILALDSPSE